MPLVISSVPRSPDPSCVVPNHICQQLDNRFRKLLYDPYKNKKGKQELREDSSIFNHTRLSDDTGFRVTGGFLCFERMKYGIGEAYAEPFLQASFCYFCHSTQAYEFLRGYLSPAVSSDHHNSWLPPQTRDPRKWNVPLHLTFSCRNILNMYKNAPFSFIDSRMYSTWKPQNTDFKSCQTLNLLHVSVQKCAGLKEHQKQTYNDMLSIQRNPPENCNGCQRLLKVWTPVYLGVCYA